MDTQHQTNAEQGDADQPEPAGAGPGVQTSESAETLPQQLAEANDRALRAQAELDNFRKRARREMDDERRYANLPLLRDILPVVDNVGRAIQAAEKTPDSSSLLEGVRMVAQQLEAVLARYGCRRIEAWQKPFDPHLHQAISQQPAADQPAGTVLLVAQEGYLLHDRVIRPAQVIVSTAPPDA